MSATCFSANFSMASAAEIHLAFSRVKLLNLEIEAAMDATITRL